MHPFQTRLRMEREIVTLVNQQMPVVGEALAGFSHAAIDHWGLAGPLSNRCDHRVEELILQMKALSTKLRLSSASSHRGSGPMVGVEAQLLAEERSSLLHGLAAVLRG